MKRRLSFILFLLLPLAARAQSMGDAEFTQKYQIASVDEAKHDLQNALRLYEELYGVHPERTDVADGYVRVLYALKRFAGAEKVIVARLDHEPQNKFDLYLLVARVRSQLGKKSEALDAFRLAAAAPNDFDSHTRNIEISSTMIEVGYLEDALAFLEQCRRDDPSSGDYTPDIAALLFKLNRYDEGSKEYIAMLGANPNALNMIEGHIASYTADTLSRRQVMKSVISQIDTNSADVPELSLLGWCYGEISDYTHALGCALLLDKKSPSAGAGFDLVNFGDRALAEGAFDAAARAYSEAALRLKKNYSTQAIYYNAAFGVIKAKEALVMKQAHPSEDNLHDLVAECVEFASPAVPSEAALPALIKAAAIEFKQLHEPAKAIPFYEQAISRAHSTSDITISAYFSLEECALAEANIPQAKQRLASLSSALEKRNRNSDAEISRHIAFELARMDYFEAKFDTAVTQLDTIAHITTSDFANDAIALEALITENRNGSSDAAMTVFAKADLLSLGSDLPSALAGFKSIRETFPKAPIADEATIRAAELLVVMGKPADAVALFEEMQEKMLESPLLDRAAFREAEITEHELAQKDKALRLYEDFLARYPKSPFCTEARQRARKLRGDVF